MRRAWLLSMMLACFAPHVFSQPVLGGRSGAAFRLGLSAEPIGMGNARIAVVGDDVDPFLNPALAPFQRSPLVSAGVGLFPLQRTVQTLSYAAPLPPSAGIAFTLERVTVDDIDGRDRNGVSTGTFKVAENVVALSFGLRPSPSFTLGATAKLFYAQMPEDITSTTVGLDFGATYLVWDDLRAAVAFRDVNSKYRWDTTPAFGRQGRQTTDLFPAAFVTGIAYAPSFLPATVAIEAEMVAGGMLLRFGTEARIHPMVRIRTGMDAVDPSGTFGSRWSGGVSLDGTGLKWDPTIDYAFVLEPFAPGSAHLLTLRIHVKE
jgi:hypothetical protein